MGTNQKLKELISTESQSLGDINPFDRDRLWEMMEPKTSSTARKLHFYMVSCILARQNVSDQRHVKLETISRTELPRSRSSFRDKTPGSNENSLSRNIETDRNTHSERSFIVNERQDLVEHRPHAAQVQEPAHDNSSIRKRQNSFREASRAVELKHQAHFSKSIDGSSRSEHGERSDERTTLKFRMANNDALRWAIGPQHSHKVAMMEEYGVHIQTMKGDDLFAVTGPRTKVVRCIIDYWQRVLEKFRNLMTMSKVQASLDLTDDVIIKFLVGYETLLINGTDSLELYSFNRQNIDRVIDELQATEENTENERINMKKTDEISVPLRIESNNVRRWIFGKNGAHVENLSKKFNVVMVQDGNGFKITGKKRDIQKTVYTVWRQISALDICPEELLRKPMDGDMIEQVRSWRDVDVATHILRFSVFLDFKRNQMVGLNLTHLNRATAAIMQRLPLSTDPNLFEDEHSLKVRITDSSAIAWLLGKQRIHFNTIEKQFNVSLELSSNVIEVTGEKTSVEQCVLHIFRELAHNRFMNQRNCPNLAQVNLRESDVIENILKFGVFFDVWNEVVYGFTDGVIDEALKCLPHIESPGENDVSQFVYQEDQSLISSSESGHDPWNVNTHLQW